MSLERRIARLEAQQNGPGPAHTAHTPPVIFYETDEAIPALMTEATVCPCCTVRLVLPMKGSR
jgi:hypothetical protein